MTFSSNSINLLQVDDEPKVAGITAEFLTRVDDEISIDKATSASEGQALLDENEYDCVVSDYDMPGMDGIEFLEAVRAKYPDLPFILHTGKGSEEVASEAMAAGVTDYVQKENGRSHYEVLANRIQNAVDRRRANQAVRDTQEWSTTLLEYSSDYLFVVDESMEISYVSPSVERVLGYTPDEVMAETSLEFTHPDDIEIATEAFDVILERPNEDVSAEFRTRHADGDYRWLEVRGRNLLDDPVIEGVLVNARDITDRKERERELDAAREASQTLIEASPMPIWVQRVEEILYANDAAAAFFGHDDTESLLGQSALAYVPEDQRKRARKRNEQMLETGEAMGELTGTVIATDGTSREAVFAAAPITYYGEHAIVTIANDITERKEQQEQLRREKERLDEFASVVSHDLRNPLNVAQGRIDLAREECDSEHLDPAAEGIERSLALIEDMLTLARGGREVGDMEPVNAADLADACWDTVATADATVVADLDATIRADRTRLRQLLENLFRNAVEHGADDVTVRIGSLTDGFYVEDDGPGIPEGERDDVWEAGYSGTDEGPGFGLSIVQQIVEAHDWEIRSTEGSEGGVRFEITGVAFAPE